MATFRKRGKKWQVQVRRQGQPPLTKTFTRKSGALTWANTVESEIERGLFVNKTASERTSIAEALSRYASEVCPTLKGETSELSRLKTIARYFGSLSLAALTTSHLAQYRDYRLTKVSPQSVKRELGLLNRTLKMAHLEWNIILPLGIPQVKHPKIPRGRERRLEGPEEEARLLQAMKKTREMQYIVRIALETAMRRGEIVKMRWSHINKGKSTLLIPETKTDRPRIIPLSDSAMTTLNIITTRIDGFVFGMKSDSITQAFERACKRAGIQDLRFHDLRHEATSRLFEKGLNIMEVATITGHQDLTMLKRYTHLKPDKLAKKLNNANF